MTAASTHVFPSELGWMAITFQGERVTRLTFGHPSATAAIADLQTGDEWVRSEPHDLPAWITDVVHRLQAYAAGSEVSFDDVPLSLEHLSPFQQRVVRHCRRIARGKVRTYGELAAAAGSPSAARAVGNVMAQNRYPIIVPCHRVVGSAGSLGGFSARDGVSMKQRMLSMEGAVVPRGRKPGRARSKGALSAAV